MVLAVVLLVALPVLTYPPGRDQALYAEVGNAILRGQTPYVDIWEQKPPLIHYLYALSIGLFGPDTTAIRMVDFLTMPFTALALFWIGQRLRDVRTGLLTVVVFGVFYFTETFASLSQSDLILTLPMTLAAAAAIHTTDLKYNSRAALLWAFITGVLCAISLLFKYFVVFFVLALVLNHVLSRRRIPVREAMAFSAGGLLFALATVIYFQATGILEQLLINAVSGTRYTAVGSSEGDFVTSMLHFLNFRWLHWGVMLVFAGLWLPLSWLNRRTQTTDAPHQSAASGWLLVWLWLLAGLLFALIQQKGFDTHWFPMLPPLALLAGDAIRQMLTGLFRVLRAGPVLRLLMTGGVIAGLLVILSLSTWVRAWEYVTGQETQQDYYARFVSGDVRPAESLQVIDWLLERVAPGDTLFIWGFRPEVYFVGGWRPATRFAVHVPLVGDIYPAEWQQQNVDVLWAAMPPCFIALENDYMPWVTGKNLDSHQLLQEYTELNNWLIYNYDRVHEIGDFLIWCRKQP